MATAQQIAEAADVTEAYARMLLAGTRKFTLPVALRVYDRTGSKFGPLTALDAAGIETARKMAEAA